MKEVDLVKKWLLNSGIQGIEGGFRAWYDLENKNYPFIYSEITGYGITTLLKMNEIGRAKVAAKWLMTNTLHECGGFIRKCDLQGKSFGTNSIYAFDTGMILYGIVNLFEATKDEIYLELAEKIAAFLIKCQKKNGLFHPIYEIKDGSYPENREKWSNQSGGFHAKIALGMVDLFEVTKKEQYKKCAEDICNATLELQEKDGRFVIDGQTHFHPHCYAAEGLLYAGIKFGNKKYMASVVKACTIALDNQLSNGGIPYLYTESKSVTYERCDILAQVLRLGCVLISLGILDKKYIVALKKLKNRLCESQHPSGGFLFGTDFDGDEKKHLNSWGSMFAFQALEMYEKVFDKKEKVSIDLFI